MRKWLTNLLLVIALGSGVVGVGAHENEGSCPMANVPDCCKKAQSASASPEASMARLCCNLNCSEPGSGGSTNSSSLSGQQGNMPNLAIIPGSTTFNRASFSLSNQVEKNPHDSKPKYIQHLALLI
jgi:hypothetical protein